MITIAAAAAGALAGTLLACLPGLHIYNALALLLACGVGAGRPEILVAGAPAMVAAWSLANAIPAVFCGSADESAVFTVLPGQKYLAAGRGTEAVLLTALGGLAGAAALLAAAPLLPRAMAFTHAVLRPHAHWMVWCIIAFMLMSEWPRGGNAGQGGWTKFADGWRSTGAGLLTFALSGLLGFVLVFRSPLPIEAAHMSLMPAFVGLFGIPWLLLNLIARAPTPAQRPARAVPADAWTVVRGAGTGIVGGALAAYLPGVTGGVGGMLAGHASAQTDDRAFLVSQGAAKFVYYAGGLLLFFVPGASLCRGGAAGMLRARLVPAGDPDYLTAAGAIALGAGLAFLLTAPLCTAARRTLARWGQRAISALMLALTLAFVAGAAGATALPILAVATAIGLIPVLYGSRRMNALGVILLPLACRMSGVDGPVAAWLGLL